MSELFQLHPRHALYQLTSFRAFLAHVCTCNTLQVGSPAGPPSAAWDIRAASHVRCLDCFSGTSASTTCYRPSCGTPPSPDLYAFPPKSRDHCHLAHYMELRKPQHDTKPQSSSWHAHLTALSRVSVEPALPGTPHLSSVCSRQSKNTKSKTCSGRDTKDIITPLNSTMSMYRPIMPKCIQCRLLSSATPSGT